MRVAFVDTETTGLETDKVFLEQRGIIQVCVEVCDLDKIGLAADPLETFTSYVQPFHGDLLSNEALELHKVTREQLEAYPAPEVVFQQLQNFLARYCDKYSKVDKMIFAAYNASFDANLLRAFFKKNADPYFGSWFWTPPVDVMTMAAARLLHHRRHMQNFKLATVVKYCGMPEAQSAEFHTAGFDTRAVHWLWNWCMQHTRPVPDHKEPTQEGV